MLYSEHVVLSSSTSKNRKVGIPRMIVKTSSRLHLDSIESYDTEDTLRLLSSQQQDEGDSTS